MVSHSRSDQNLISKTKVAKEAVSSNILWKFILKSHLIRDMKHYFETKMGYLVSIANKCPLNYRV